VAISDALAGGSCLSLRLDPEQRHSAEPVQDYLCW